MKVLIIDNYDSFTYNLYQYVGELLNSSMVEERPQNYSNDVIVKRNNEISVDDVKALQPDRIIISPGPGSPQDDAYFGVCSEVILQMGARTPLLGVCLGMQGIAHVFGGKVVLADLPMHGKTSPIRHDDHGVYQRLPQEVEIMRYHSLMVKAEGLPDCLDISAVVENADHASLSLTQRAQTGDEIMGVRHKHYPIEGVQFHPESFATEGAKRLLANFLNQVQ